MLKSPRDMVSALECTLDTIKVGQGEKRTLFQHDSCHHFSPTPSVPWGGGHRRLSCHSPHLETSQCLQSQSTALWLILSSPGWWNVHYTLLPQTPTPTVTLKMDGVPVSVPLDSRCTITLARLSALPQSTQPCRSLAIPCVHGDM